MDRPNTFVENDEEEFVLPKERLVQDIFGQLRNISGDCLEKKTEDEMVASREVMNECRKCRPILERTLSHETTLKRQKREHFRMSLNEELLHSEWAIYSPEELKILDFVVRKASLEDTKSNKGRKTSRLQKIRIHRPKIFSRNHNTTKSKKSDIPDTSEYLHGKSITENGYADGKMTPRKPSFIKRFIESASHLRSPSASPKLARRRSNEVEKRQNTAMRDISNSPSQCHRRPIGNFQVHALLQEEVKRSSSLQCLSQSSFSVTDDLEKARVDVLSGSPELRRRMSDGQSKRQESKEKVKLFRAPDSRHGVDYYLEDTETFFERFEHFCKNPMILLDATEIDC